MSSPWWQGVRATARSGKCLFDGRLSCHGMQSQKGSVASSNLSFLVRMRSISSSAVKSSSGNDSGSGGPWDPPKELPGQDVDTPSDSGDKRMWRKWIEERLGKPGTEDPTEASVSKPFLRNTVSSSSGPDQQSGPPVRRSPFPKRYTPSPETVVSREERSSALDSAFKAAFNQSRPAETENAEGSEVPKFRNPFHQENTKSSFFPDRSPKKNPSFVPWRGSLLQESKRQPAIVSESQITSKSPRQQLDNLSVEALDDFEHRVLGSPNDADESIDDDFLHDLDEIGRSARGISYENEDDVRSDEDEDWGSEKVQGLTDLALSNAEEFDLEDEEHPYRMRPDRLFFPGQTYDPEDLDLSKEADAEKPTVRTRKKFPTKEVFKIADFRNPRFLTNFIRESSRILPKRHFRISAKAQRKVAREIKTARMLGLMPFTSMGDPPFKFLRSRAEEDTYTSGRFDGYQDFRPF